MEENLSISEIIDSIKEEETIIKKKKRGRPPKNKTEEKVKEKVPISNEDNEIIVHLKNLSKDDIDKLEENGMSLLEIDKNINSITNEQTDKMEDTLKISNLKYIIKNLSDENKDLKEYIDKLTPMFNTEIKHYENNIFTDINDNIIEPKLTNLCCYNCCYEFNTYPLYDIIGFKNGKFIISGNGNSKLFCSFNCYLTNILSDNDFNKKDRLLKKLYYELYKDNIKDVSAISFKPADDRLVLEKFGGPLTISEYRKNFKLILNEIKILQIPFIATPFIVEETTKQSNKIDYLLNNNPNITNK